jgi:hypothetical protein
MLRKLIKYDLLWINRVLIVYYAITVVLSVLTRISGNYTDSVMGDIIHRILIGCTIGAFVNTLINAAIRIWVRFRQNCYKDEAYLTHTLPATKAQLYDSKIYSALITTLIALAVVIICFFIAFWNDDMYQYFHNLVQIEDMAFVLIGMIVTAVLEVIYIIAVGIFGIVLGHRANNNRMVISILIGVVLYFSLQTVLLVVVFIAGFFDDSIMAMFKNNPDNSIGFDSYRTLIIITDISYFVLNAGLFLGAKKLFASGVNVD